MTEFDIDRQDFDQPSPVRVAASWVAWHAVELAVVGVPAALALTVTAWLWVIAVGAAGLWVGHEVRQSRARQALRAAGPRSELDAGNPVVEEQPAVEDSEVRHG